MVRVLALVLVALGLAGCATTVPYTAEGVCLALKPHMPLIADHQDTPATKDKVFRLNMVHRSVCVEYDP